MPSSVGSALLLFAIVLALCAFVTAAVVAGALGVAWEAFLFYRAGVDGVG